MPLVGGSTVSAHSGHGFMLGQIQDMIPDVVVFVTNTFISTRFLMCSPSGMVRSSS